ncbi:hypothetical protein AN219_27310 [Streptomyces nanshensis]|nr:hypothetical protein AN219_27310 [Streptomyces nanshensis]
MPDSGPLIIVERAYRGSVETQFADVLYFIRELNRQTGGLHLALRGLTATYALEAPSYEPTVRLGSRRLDTLPDPRASIREMLDDDAVVWVEEPDLARLGPTARTRLLDGVRCAAQGELTLRWAEFPRVWFM